MWRQPASRLVSASQARLRRERAADKSSSSASKTHGHREDAARRGCGARQRRARRACVRPLALAPPTARRANGALLLLAFAGAGAGAGLLLFRRRHLRLHAPGPKAAAVSRRRGGVVVVPGVPQRVRRHPRQRLLALARPRRLPLRRPSSWGGVRVRGARRGGERDLRGGAAAVPRVRLPGGDPGGDNGADARRGARAHGGPRRGLPRRRLQPRLPQLQPLLRRRVPPPRSRPHPALGQPPRQDRGRLHLRHPGQRRRGAAQGGCPHRRRREGQHPQPLRAPGRGRRCAAAAQDVLPLPLRRRRRRRQQERDAAAALDLADTTRSSGVYHRHVTAPFLYFLQFHLIFLYSVKRNFVHKLKIKLIRDLLVPVHLLG